MCCIVFSVLFCRLIRLICSINASLLHCWNIDIAHWHFLIRQNLNLCLIDNAVFVMVGISLVVHEHRYVVLFLCCKCLMMF